MQDNRGNNTFGVSRRQLIQATSAAAAAAAIDASFARAFAQSGPIKIAVLNTFTKSVALFGEATWRGFEFYLDEHGRKLAGRPVELIREDDEFNPQVGLQKLRKLVESDKAHLILGPLGSHIAAAMVGYMKTNGTPWIVTGAGSSVLTKNRLPNMFRSSLTNWQVAHPMGSWAAQNNVKNTVIVASDFLAGHDVAGSFKGTYTAAGGKILREVFPPVGTNDFSAYLTNIRSINPESVYVFLAGSEAARFVKQFQQFGLKDKVKLLGFQSTLDSDVFPLQGDSALGGLSSSIYAELLDTSENKEFVAKYRKKYSEWPGIFSETGYSTMMMIDKALSAASGKIEDRAAFSGALAKTSIVAPRGPVSFDPVTHQAIHNIYIREVVKHEDKILNKVIATVANVGDMPANK